MLSRSRFRPLLLTVFLMATAACSSTDDTPPVARVSVTTPASRVAIGGPIDLAYRFEPTGERIDGDYNVFVHLVNSDGQMLWADDHPPAVPTSSWRSGEVIEYGRKVFLPALQLRPGDVTLEIGLYREGDRLPLAAAREPRQVGTRAYPVLDLQLAPESENVFLLYQAGWHPDEFSEQEPGRSWKWTQKVATVAFRHPKRAAQLLIEYAGRPDAFGAMPQTLSVIGADNQVLASFPVDSTELVLRSVPMTAAQMGTGDLAELRLEVDRVFIPAQHGGGQDTRELGVRVYNVFVDVR